MKLHEDKYSFLNILNLINESSGIRTDILEKDYYVTLLLKELADKQKSLPAYFKGGTNTEFFKIPSFCRMTV